MHDDDDDDSFAIRTNTHTKYIVSGALCKFELYEVRYCSTNKKEQKDERDRKKSAKANKRSTNEKD